MPTLTNHVKMNTSLYLLNLFPIYLTKITTFEISCLAFIATHFSETLISYFSGRLAVSSLKTKHRRMLKAYSFFEVFKFICEE